MEVTQNPFPTSHVHGRIMESARIPYVGMTPFRNTLHSQPYLTLERNISPQNLHRQTLRDLLHNSSAGGISAIKRRLMSGGDSKSLSVPVTSASFKWTASAVSGKTKKSTIYILAREKLKVLLLNSKGLSASSD